MAKNTKKKSVVNQLRLKATVNDRYKSEADSLGETKGGYIRRVLELLAESDPTEEYNLIDLAKSGGAR